MANKIVLPPQTVNFDLLYIQFPPLGSSRRKLIFQSVLKSLAGNNAYFGLVGYPLWRNNAAHPWQTGTAVPTTDSRPPEPNDEYDPPLTFGNIEVPLSRHALEIADKDKKIDKEKEAAFDQFLAFLKKITENADLLKQSKLEFKESKITSNPHADYDVTLVSGGTSQPAVTNPSPPADPDEG